MKMTTTCAPFLIFCASVTFSAERGKKPNGDGGDANVLPAAYGLPPPRPHDSPSAAPPTPGCVRTWPTFAPESAALSSAPATGGTSGSKPGPGSTCAVVNVVVVGTV